jgi:hypothetical protein
MSLLRVDPRDRRPEASHNIFMKILKEEKGSKYKIRFGGNWKGVEEWSELGSTSTRARPGVGSWSAGVNDDQQPE